MLREQVRDDSLIAASDKARGRLRTLDVSGCSEVSHNAVISVLRKNQKLAHVKMAERQADGHRLRIRPRQLVDVACALGKRANGTPATLEASVDVAGNRELEALRDVVVDAARSQRSSASASTSGSAPRAVNPLVVGGTRVVISSLTLSLLFLERVLLEANDDAFDAEDDADENDAEASVARETARVAAALRLRNHPRGRSARVIARHFRRARARRQSRRVARARSVARKLRRIASRDSSRRRSAPSKQNATGLDADAPNDRARGRRGARHDQTRLVERRSSRRSSFRRRYVTRRRMGLDRWYRRYLRIGKASSGSGGRAADF